MLLPLCGISELLDTGTATDGAATAQEALESMKCAAGAKCFAALKRFCGNAVALLAPLKKILFGTLRIPVVVFQILTQ